MWPDQTRPPLPNQLTRHPFGEHFRSANLSGASNASAQPTRRSQVLLYAIRFAWKRAERRLHVHRTGPAQRCGLQAEAIRALARLRDIKIEFSPGNEYQGTYVHLLLAMTMIVIEGLPRGGQIIIDADNGVVIGNGTKCFLHSETHESIIGNVKQPSSRHALGILVYEFAKNCNASVVVEHTSTKLILSLNNSFSNSTNPLGML